MEKNEYEIDLNPDQNEEEIKKIFELKYKSELVAFKITRKSLDSRNKKK